MSRAFLRKLDIELIYANTCFFAQTCRSVSGDNETNVVVSLMTVLSPKIHDHTVGALRRAGAASVSNEVLSTPIRPSTVRVMAVMALMLVTRAQVVAHWHSASFKLERNLILRLLYLINETCGALCDGLLLLISLLSFSVSLLLFLLQIFFVFLGPLSIPFTLSSRLLVLIALGSSSCPTVINISLCRHTVFGL